MYLSIQNLQNFLLPVLWLHTRSKEFVIWDYKSAWDQTRFAMHLNKTYLVWLMYWLLFNQHYQHHTNQKLHLWANIIEFAHKCFLLSHPLPCHSFFLPSSQLSQRTRIETLATQVTGLFRQACRCVCVCRLEYTVDLWRAAWKRPWIGWVLI